MSSRDFCFWLMGYFEITEDEGSLSSMQVESIKNHLRLVFKHEIDPSMPGDPQELQNIHDGVVPFNKPNQHLFKPQQGSADGLLRC